MYDVEIQNGNTKIPISGIDTGHRVIGSITKEKNKIPSFTFTIYPDNPGFDKITEYKTLVRVKASKVPKFAGRVLLSQPQIDSSGIIYKSVTCEGFLGYLNDTLNYLYSMPADKLLINKIVEYQLNNHNKQVEKNKQIQYEFFATGVGLEEFVPTEDRTTFSALTDEQLTAYLMYDVVEQGTDLVLKCGTTMAHKNTAIQLGLNMQSLTVVNNFDDLCTVVLPITNDNRLMGTVGKDVITVIDSNAVAEYGTIVKSHKFESISSPSKLAGAAREWLSSRTAIKKTITVSAFDLYDMGITPERFDIYSDYLIECPELGVHERLELTKLTQDINDTWNTQLTFGDILYSARNQRL